MPSLRKLKKQATKLGVGGFVEIKDVKPGISWRIPKKNFKQNKLPAVARAIGPNHLNQAFQNPRLMAPRNPASKRHTLQRVSSKKLESRQEARKQQRKELREKTRKARMKAITTKGSKGPAKRRKHG